MKQVAVINGPNLNMIGKREPELYGSTTLADVEKMIQTHADRLGIGVSFFQSNSEGDLVTRIQQCLNTADGIIINPGAYGHYAYSLYDALLGVGLPCIEVHISNTHKREPFRHHSVLVDACVGQICGMGIDGYRMALEKMKDML
ncbi:MAG: type II 3-dehydroquinate dehydratase [Candidatus Limiplasma sp.]|nr:type II 3-dehydroquinate dehydratase [Candidatus Limiplasma sp.]